LLISAMSLWLLFERANAFRPFVIASLKSPSKAVYR